MHKFRIGDFVRTVDSYSGFITGCFTNIKGKFYQLDNRTHIEEFILEESIISVAKIKNVRKTVKALNKVPEFLPTSVFDDVPIVYATKTTETDNKQEKN